MPFLKNTTFAVLFLIAFIFVTPSFAYDINKNDVNYNAVQITANIVSQYSQKHNLPFTFMKLDAPTDKNPDNNLFNYTISYTLSNTIPQYLNHITISHISFSGKTGDEVAPSYKFNADMTFEADIDTSGTSCVTFNPLVYSIVSSDAFAQSVLQRALDANAANIVNSFIANSDLNNQFCPSSYK